MSHSESKECSASSQCYFVRTWLFVAVGFALFVWILLYFKNPILDFCTRMFHYIDWI